MAKKRPAIDRFLLERKFEAVDNYIAHHERNLDQFRIDIQKAVLFRSLGDAQGFLDRLIGILSDLFTADPSISILKEDLRRARDEINADYRAEPEWVGDESREYLKLIDCKYENQYDVCLAIAMKRLLDYMHYLMNLDSTWEQSNALLIERAGLLEKFCIIYDASLDPARLLRHQMTEVLGGQISTSNQTPMPKRRRGRPKDPGLVDRNQTIREEWKSGKYETRAELGEIHHLSAASIEKIVKGIVPDRKPMD